MVIVLANSASAAKIERKCDRRGIYDGRCNVEPNADNKKCRRLSCVAFDIQNDPGHERGDWRRNHRIEL